MTTWTKWTDTTRAAIAGALLLGLSAGGLRAQTTPEAGPATAERATLLAEYAEEIAGTRQDYETAAVLLREAAGLRGGDGVAAKHLARAGHLFYYAGLATRAVQALEAAGELAESLGDRYEAARSYYAAAWVAGRSRDVAAARALLERSRALDPDVTMAGRTP